MIRIGKQLRDAIRGESIVITADRSAPVYQDKPRTVNRTAARFFAFRDSELESIARNRGDRVLRTGKKIPAERFFSQLVRIRAQDGRRVRFRIDTERDETHVALLKRLLQFAHPRTDDRAWSLAGGKYKISDPNFADQLLRAKGLRVLIDELEIWNAAVRWQRPIRKGVYLHLPQPEKNGGGNERDQDKR